MNGKVLSLVTAAALLSSIGAPSAQGPMRLSDDQLDKVTAGANFSEMPALNSFLVNGSNGAGGVNQFSPSIATVVPTITNVDLCVFCVTTAPHK
jgi:hypothetical protein